MSPNSVEEIITGWSQLDLQENESNIWQNHPNVYIIVKSCYPRPEAGIALNMRSRIFMFLDVRTYDHETNASNIQKAHILANRIIFILKGGLNMTEEHPKKTATKIFGHIWMSIQLTQNCNFG